MYAIILIALSSFELPEPNHGRLVCGQEHLTYAVPMLDGTFKLIEDGDPLLLVLMRYGVEIPPAGMWCRFKGPLKNRSTAQGQEVPPSYQAKPRIHGGRPPT